LLSILFLVTAALYSSVGFGGGSTYLALLLIWDTPYYIFPIIALSCNIIVVSGNCFNYIRQGNLKLKLLLPYLIGSIPFAYLGGALHIEKFIFEVLLFLILITAGSSLLYNFKSHSGLEETHKNSSFITSVLIGGVIGFISGVVGIGGGIFLSPILFLLRAAKPKDIVICASLFILINSIVGITGQLSKNSILLEVQNYWFLLLAVFLGGQIGNYLNLKVFPVRFLGFITAFLVIFVAIRMGIRLF